MSGTGVYDILNPIMDGLAIGLAQGSRRFNQYMEQTIAFNNVQQAVDHANAWQDMRKGWKHRTRHSGVTTNS